MEPVIGNSLSNTCDNPMSSSCVTYAGGNLPCINICKGASIGDVIYAMGQKLCQVTSDTSPCYTGDWVDFTSSIPTSGITSGGFNWAINGFGSQFSPFSSSTGPENTPSYKWTSSGDLKIRGTFNLDIIPVTVFSNSFFAIPLVSIPTSCFPANWTASQTAIVSTDAFLTVERQALNIITRGFLTLAYPSGILYLNFSFAPVSLTNFSVFIPMGGTTFNIA